MRKYLLVLAALACVAASSASRILNVISNSVTGSTQYAHGTIFTSLSDQTVNTTGATSCLGSGAPTIAAGGFVTGSKIRFSCLGYYTTPASSPGTLTFTVKLGSNTALTAQTGTLPTSSSTQGLQFVGECTVRSSTTISCNSRTHLYYGGVGGVSETVFGFAGSPQTIATNSSQTLDILVTMSAGASGTDYAVFQEASVEVIN